MFMLHRMILNYCILYIMYFQLMNLKAAYINFVLRILLIKLGIFCKNCSSKIQPTGPESLEYLCFCRLLYLSKILFRNTWERERERERECVCVCTVCAYACVCMRACMRVCMCGRARPGSRPGFGFFPRPRPRQIHSQNPGPG